MYQLNECWVQHTVQIADGRSVQCIGSNAMHYQEGEWGLSTTHRLQCIIRTRRLNECPDCNAGGWKRVSAMRTDHSAMDPMHYQVAEWGLITTHSPTQIAVQVGLNQGQCNVVDLMQCINTRVNEGWVQHTDCNTLSGGWMRVRSREKELAGMHLKFRIILNHF